MYTEHELQELTMDQLKAILGTIPGPMLITGVKATLMKRVLDNATEIPDDHVKLTKVRKNEPPPPPQPLPTVDDPLAEDQPITELIAHLKLCQRTADFLAHENIIDIAHVMLYEETEILEWEIPSRDRKALQHFAYPPLKEADQPAPALPPPAPPVSHPPQGGRQPAHRGRQQALEKEDTRSVQSIASHKPTDMKHQSHSSSSGESSSDSDSSTDSESDHELPLHARNLPRPHKFMSARLSKEGKERKPKALEIDMPEFLTESARIVRQLTDLPSHSETAREYSAYVEYINQRNCDYVPSAVLRFDDDFRRRAKQLKLSLTDSDLRRSLSEKYFHAATRKSKSGYNLSESNNSFRSGQRYSSNAFSSNANKQPPICQQFNAGNCTYGRACRFQHKCRDCNGLDHGAAFCYLRAQQYQLAFQPFILNAKGPQIGPPAQPRR